MTEQDDPEFNEFSMSEVIRIPNDRLGVLIGKDGQTKAALEKLTETIIKVDSDENVVSISKQPKSHDPGLVWTAREVVRAIGRGFSERLAFKLADPNFSLRIITIERGKNKNRLLRIRGRIIGEKGRTRRVIEEVTQVNVSVYGDTVSLIGKHEDLETAQEAVGMLISGVKHGTVYRFLERHREEKKAEKPKIWQTREDMSFDKMWDDFQRKIKTESADPEAGSTESRITEDSTNPDNENDENPPDTLELEPKQEDDAPSDE